jgi:hypothetical protein
MTDSKEAQVREALERAQFAEDLTIIKRSIDGRVAEKVAREAGLEEPEAAKLRAYLGACRSDENREACEVFLVKSATLPGTYEGAPVEPTKAVYQVAYGDEPDPGDFESKDSLSNVWERFLAVFQHAVSEKPVESELTKPLELGKPEGLKRFRALLEESLEGTRLSEDAEAKKMLLGAEGRALDELEVHSVVLRKPGEQLDIDNPSTYTMQTVVTKWPADPPHPTWNPTSGSPPSGTAFVLKTRTLRSIGGELADRARIRFLHGRHAEELLAPRRRLFE